MPDGFGFPFLYVPIPIPCKSWTQSQLTIYPPFIGITPVFRMIKNGNIGHVIPSFHLHGHIDPHGGLPFCIFVSLSGGVKDFSVYSFFPGHSYKQTPVIIFTYGNVSFGFTFPLQIQKIFTIFLFQRPVLGFFHYNFSIFTQQLVDGLPLDCFPLFFNNV